MKKYLRKIGALLMTVVMVLGVCATVFAADVTPTPAPISGSKPTSNDRGSITVSGIQAGDKVTIYKIVQAKYNDYGFVKYEPVSGVDIADATQPTPEEIAVLLNKSLTLAGENTVAGGSTSLVFSNLAIGTYLVKVDAGEGNLTVYNPMIASVFYVTSENQTAIQDGAVSADDYWSIKGDVAYAKSSKDITPDKNIVDADGTVIVNGQAAGKGDAVAKGDTVHYTISGTIPSYDPAYYTDPVYTVIDKLSDGLDFATDTKEEVQKQANEKFGAGNATVTVTGRELKIELKSSYITSIAAKTSDERKFSFTYSAVLNGSSVNFDPSTNTVKVNYSKTPTETDDSKPAETYHYTFAFNGEAVKVDEEKKTLAGAEFGLFTDAECKTEAVYANTQKQITATSEADGTLKFTGLDNKDYYMKEIKTPSTEYKLNDTVYKIKFEPTFVTGGKMESYKVIITDMTSGKAFETVYKYDAKNNKADIIGCNEIVKIQNTKLGELPSTGGTGTYLFTVMGVMVMAAVTGMFLVSRAKDRRENQ